MEIEKTMRIKRAMNSKEPMDPERASVVESSTRQERAR